MVTNIKQYNPSVSAVVSDWQVIDASGQVLGRLATQVATLLMGKHRPTYVPHMLSGDFVIVINASEVKVTGLKAEKKVYKRHSQYPGNLKEIPYTRMQERHPERIIELAVKGMLPKSKLGRQMLKRLKIYSHLLNMEEKCWYLFLFTLKEILKQLRMIKLMRKNMRISMVTDTTLDLAV